MAITTDTIYKLTYFGKNIPIYTEEEFEDISFRISTAAAKGGGIATLREGLGDEYRLFVGQGSDIVLQKLVRRFGGKLNEETGEYE
ncbi:hypothetical protein [Subtercola sp. YIM 133946]|uniref:hypothetical protein n=1 Tax=Subtercola sp. YIM 133946 TaxID=3118909 RepID=UPI002F940E4A